MTSMMMKTWVQREGPEEPHLMETCFSHLGGGYGALSAPGVTIICVKFWFM